HSVTIVSVGFSTNLVRLLRSAPDQYSALNGKDLIAKKVKFLSVMAGSFRENPAAEFNVVRDIPSAKALAEEWPGQVVYTPLEAGLAVTYPATSIQNDFAWATFHPLVEAYKQYKPMPYDRPCWDPIALLYVMDSSSKFFTHSGWGKVAVDEKGHTLFSPDVNGNRQYITLTTDQAAAIRSYFIEQVTRVPKFHKK
ncbi:MAG: nucleoside hydrolase, partial [Bacteroidales bacterium]|nr:nucleoside hydrolase [Bacteroidales bacterium]